MLRKGFRVETLRGKSNEEVDDKPQWVGRKEKSEKVAKVRRHDMNISSTRQTRSLKGK